MGRPSGSQIRQNVIDILQVIKTGYGYQIFKIHRELKPNATMRAVYYQLKKGVETGELKVDRIEKASGDYSWGSEAEKIIYRLGDQAKPKSPDKVKNILQKKNKE